MIFPALPERVLQRKPMGNHLSGVEATTGEQPIHLPPRFPHQPACCTDDCGFFVGDVIGRVESDGLAVHERADQEMGIRKREA